MPDQTEIPVSSFPDAQSINGGDKVTGLQGNVNKNFTFSSILAWFVNAVKSAFVPIGRTINGKSLSSDITLTASDVGARPNTWTPSASDVGAIPATAAGEPLGIAELGSDGKVPSSQLPAIPSQPSDIGAQAEITASGILKGDGAGGVAAATAGTDYATPAQLADKAAKADLTSIQATGTTNTTGAAILAGAYFYLNGILYRAKTQIDQNATFNVNTNCEQATEGGFNSLISNTLTRVLPLGSSSIKSYADSLRTGGFVEWVEYYSTNPDAPSNYHGYAQIIFMSSNYITVIAYDRNGKIYQMRKASSWGAWITLH